MRVLAAYMLCVLGGKAQPTKADIVKILDSVGEKADDERINKVLTELNGKDIDALIASGSLRLGAGGFSVPSSGGAAPAGGAAAPAGGAPAAGGADKGGKGGKGGKPEAKKPEPEKPKEPEPAEPEEPVMSLFD